LLLAALLVRAAAVPAQTAESPTTEPDVSVRISIKSTAFVSQLPGSPGLVDDRRAVTGFWRLRFEPTVRASEAVGVEFALDQRVRASSSVSVAVAGGVLPSTAAAPFRIHQLDWQLSSSDRTEWRAEIDRAAVHVRWRAAEMTAGRQAIGWGRTVMFGALDIFSPFTPLEADREWRRGVDAVRADVKMTPRTSLDVVAAIGDAVDRSAFAARVRGFAGKMDLEIMGGRRATDACVGVSSSAALGDAEVHGEVARFGVVTKGVAGGSYRLALGTGLLAVAEYHYSGFGATSAAGMLTALGDPVFRERYLRGDTQLLGRHVVAALASYEWSPELSGTAQWLQSPVDGSGVAVPSLTLTLSDKWSVAISGYVPYGHKPREGTLGSEFGRAPLVALIQARIYR
jgi:hypothetical protein